MFFGYLNLLYPLPSSNVVTSTDATPTGAAAPLSTACGDIISYANEDLSNNWQFYAYEVYDCLTSVPFNDAVASRFINYYNTTIQFQSTLAYLKNPPASYQQPGIDVQAALSEIQHNVTTGVYTNEYDFEAEVQSLVYAMHDSHVSLDAGVLSSFYFGSPFDIMSVSVDGKQAPQIYVANDVINSAAQGYTPSPIVSINGEDATAYMRRFAALNSPGMLEPHADWNQLMYNPIQDVLGTFSVFGWETTFYPGDSLNVTFANQSTIETYWLAFYRNTGDTGPLTTGGDFYNYFVLGLLPASYQYPNTTSTDNSTDTTDGSNDGNDDVTPALTSWSSISGAFPEYADVVQTGLAVSANAYITGYFYPDISTAVISIPTFSAYGDDIDTFMNATETFIREAQNAGMKKVVIDLQQNSGGTVLLAYDTFKQFFPNLEPFAGSRRRSHHLADILGGAITDFWDSLTPDSPDEAYSTYYEILAANEWVVTDRLNAATGMNFTSWEQYFGPLRQHDDDFSLVERYNMTSLTFFASAFSGYIPTGYEAGDTEPPWDAKDIVLLTDGTCGSTCSLFVEAMTHQAGVHSVVVGGLPVNGPMQTASGTRGARPFSADELDNHFQFASSINTTANTTLPQVRDAGIYTYNIGFNLRDQLRQDEEVPLQFQYDAAQCRIYYTLANAYNLTRLWHDAAAATWDDPSLCVAGSTGFATSANTTAANSPPQIPGDVTSHNIVKDQYNQSDDDQKLFSSIPDDIYSRLSEQFTPYIQGACKSVSVACDGTMTYWCQPNCNEGEGNPCAFGAGICRGNGEKMEAKQGVRAGRGGRSAVVNSRTRTVFTGYCVPNPSLSEAFCTKNGLTLFSG